MKRQAVVVTLHFQMPKEMLSSVGTSGLFAQCYVVLLKWQCGCSGRLVTVHLHHCVCNVPAEMMTVPDEQLRLKGTGETGQLT